MHDSPTSTRPSKLIGALVGAVAALSIGGVGMAFAQEAETPTTEAPAAQTPAPQSNERPEDCPEKDGPGGGGGADASATDTADAV